MSENQALSPEIAELQLAVLELEARIDEMSQELDELHEKSTKAEIADDFAASILEAMMLVLPFLLRGHPAAAEVEQCLKSRADLYLKLTAHLETCEPIDPGARSFEAAKMLYFHLAEAGVLPGMTPERVAQEVLPHYER